MSVRGFRLTRHGFTVAEGCEFANGLTALRWTDADHPNDKVLSGPRSSLTGMLAEDGALTIVWDDEAEAPATVGYGGLVLHLLDGLVLVGAHPLGYLSPLPRRALACLLRNPRQTVTMETLTARLYPDAEPGSRTNAVQVNLVTVRRLLGPDSIETVRGVGYRLGHVRGMDGGEPDDSRSAPSAGSADMRGLHAPDQPAYR